MNWKGFFKPTLGKMLLPIISIIYVFVYELLATKFVISYFSSNSFFFFPWLVFIFFVPWGPLLPYTIAVIVALLVNAVLWYLVSALILTQKRINTSWSKFFIFLIVFVLNFALVTYGIYMIH